MLLQKRMMREKGEVFSGWWSQDIRRLRTEEWPLGLAIRKSLVTPERITSRAQAAIPPLSYRDTLPSPPPTLMYSHNQPNTHTHGNFSVRVQADR